VQRFRNILFFDTGHRGSTRALRRAWELARRNDARLTVLGVTEAIPSGTRRLFEFVGLSDVEEWDVEDARKRLRGLARNLVPANQVIRVEVSAGTPFLEVTRQVVRAEHDLVMINAAGEKGAWFGSTVTHLLRKCPCPVWVLRPEPVERYERILVAVTSRTDDEVRMRLDQRLLEVATSLARMEHSDLHVVTVWSVVGENVIQSQTGLRSEDLDQIRFSARRSRTQRLDDLLGGVDTTDLRVRTHLVKGTPDILVPEIAREVQAELIVVGTVGRTGIAGLLIGNTAESIFAQVECPVLAIKPDGYQTPVRTGVGASET